MNIVSDEDRDAVFAALAADWPRLKGARIYLTGGTGFIGQWLLAALADADRRLDLKCRVVIVSRDPAAFAARAPHLAAHPGFRFIIGDVLAPATVDGAFSHVIHAATDASADLNLNNPAKMFDTVVTGTRHALDLAVGQPGARFFYLSSGAVYGAQPWDLTHVGEEWRGGPDCTEPKNAYAEGKRAAEMLCGIYAKQFNLDIVTARIFALLGPLLSLDIHFAAGNFIRDALARRTITVEGAGTAVRSYLYAADLTTWLWTMLLRAERGSTYNVGSEEDVSIADLAARTATQLGGTFEVLGRPDPGWNPGRYVPATGRIRSELGLWATVGLDEAIRRTAIANGWKP